MSIFKKLKLTTECVFKQIDGCAMGRPISVVLLDIYVCKMEEDIVHLQNLFSTSVMWMIPMSEEKK